MEEQVIPDGLKYLLITLLAAHFIGDFLFQPDALAEAKRKNKWYLLIHTSIVAALSYVLSGLWDLWLIPAVVFVTHALVDRLKGQSQKSTSFLLDQFGHIAFIFGLSWFLIGHSLHPSLTFSTCSQTPIPLWLDLFGPLYYKFLVVVSALVAAILGGGILTQLVVNPLLEQIRTDATVDDERARGFENAGKIIGQLERTLILIFILVGHTGAIGFLVAAKSVFRFGELKQRKEAEYIIIGTLTSFTVAIVIGYIAHKALESLSTW
jgi:hypothetical protein